MASWEATAAASQSAVLTAIPTKWRLKERPDPSVTNLEITEMTTSDLTRNLHLGALTAVEVTEAFCARAAVAHQCVNCLTDYFYDEAIAHARNLDWVLQTTGKVVGPLHGVPVAIKDYLQMKDKTTTFGFIAWHDKIAHSDSSIVQVLVAAGVIPLARTTMPQTGMLLQTTSNLWGRTVNPYNTGFSAGGSSGGDGSLVAMHGSPFCPSTDIGGSIPSPAAFNGLYGIRPTADRIPKFGMTTATPGQISIKVSCGPVCHSVEDIKLVTKLLLSHSNYIGFEPTAVPLPWKDPPPVPGRGRMCYGLMKSDGCVTPQPPISRALNETAELLKAKGHAVIEFSPSFDLWEAFLTTWALYFQTDAKETKGVVASGGEPLVSSYEWYYNILDVQASTTSEVFQLNTKQAAYKRQFYQA